MPAMEIRTFWAIIESAQSGHPFDEALVDVLAARPRQDILEYHERFGELQSALYRWDVWAAAYLIGGGCSDDSFTDFRAGLIAEEMRRRLPRLSAACLPDNAQPPRRLLAR
jgi:hypothetical protein